MRAVPLFSVLVIVVAAVGANAASRPASAWKISVKRDAMTDARSVAAEVNGAGGGIVLDCSPSSSPNLRVMVVTNRPIDAEGGFDMPETIRFDQAAAETPTWSRVGTSLAILKPEATDAFLGGLRTAGTLRVRFLSSIYGEILVTLRVAGASPVIDRMTRECL